VQRRSAAHGEAGGSRNCKTTGALGLMHKHTNHTSSSAARHAGGSSHSTAGFPGSALTAGCKWDMVWCCSCTFAAPKASPHVEWRNTCRRRPRCCCNRGPLPGAVASASAVCGGRQGKHGALVAHPVSAVAALGGVPGADRRRGAFATVHAICKRTPGLAQHLQHDHAHFITTTCFKARRPTIACEFRRLRPKPLC